MANRNCQFSACSIQVLSVASEMFPFVKTGGLGDVVGSLPAALMGEAVAVSTLLPGYPAVMAALTLRTKAAEMTLLAGVSGVIWEGTIAGRSLFVLDIPELYDRKGNPYLGPDGLDWPDNGIRFAALARAAANIAQGKLQSWQPDIVLSHDWQAGLVSAYLHYDAQPAAPVVHTIHNIAFQGRFPAHNLVQFGLPAESFSPDGVEYYGDIGFLKAGLKFAQWITTVSPGYAQEIQTAEWGMGLDGLLRSRSDRIKGILNGIDTAEWDPATDPSVLFPYQVGDMKARRPNKWAFQAEFGLRQDPDIFLLGLVSRLTGQKGVDILADIIPRIIDEHTQLVVVGSGDAAIEQKFARLARQFPNRFACHIGYSEELAHRVQASADALLIPSRFEPCGLTQLCACRYGSVPIAARVGGLADTIVDANAAAIASHVATGLLFTPTDADTLVGAIGRGAELFRNKSEWARIQRNGSHYDVSWGKKARQYAQLFRRVLGITDKPVLEQVDETVLSVRAKRPSRARIAASQPSDTRAARPAVFSHAVPRRARLGPQQRPH